MPASAPWLQQHSKRNFFGTRYTVYNTKWYKLQVVKLWQSLNWMFGTKFAFWKFVNILRQRCGCVRYWWKVDERRAPPSSVRQIWPKFPHFDDDDPIVQLIASLPLVGASGDRRLRILARNSGPAYRSSNGGCPRPTPLVPHNQPNTRSIIIFSQHLLFFWPCFAVKYPLVANQK